MRPLWDRANDIQSVRETDRFVRHIDEVHMIEGALQIHTKTVGDVMQAWKKVYCIRSDTILDEASILDIYRSGRSRIPVYKGRDTKNTVGLFRARQLAVISAEEQRPLATIPLAIPFCVAPSMNMVDLLNLLQAGKGHMAVVCIHPEIAENGLIKDEAIPSKAHVVGLVTLEVCIEELMQEEIYDEYDKEEREMNLRSKWVIDKWKKFVQKKKLERSWTPENGSGIAHENTQLLV